MKAFMVSVWLCCAASAKAWTHQQETVAACLVLEAGGEADPEAAMTAVANVIQRRADARGMTFSAVVSEPGQFSCMRRGVRAAIASARRHERWMLALAVAVWAEIGLLPDVARGADHFYAPKLCSPAWAEMMRTTAVVGSHRFGVIE